MDVQLLRGDVRDVLPNLESGSVQCVVTSPPYWGLRDYGTGVWEGGDKDCTHESNRGKQGANGQRADREYTQRVVFKDICGKCGAVRIDSQIGLEPTPAEYVETMVAVFREVRRVLRDDGTLWLNLGDCYAGSGRGGYAGNKSGLEGSTEGQDQSRIARGSQLAAGLHATAQKAGAIGRAWVPPPAGLKSKDLIGVPWMVAFALRADGWYLRQDLIWCLSGGAWIYARTQKGDMPVMVKDLVRLDPKTVQLWNGDKWTRVLGWGPSNDESERIEIVLRSGERIGCTGGHQWPTQRGNVVAHELVVGDTIQTCRLPEQNDCERPSYLTNDALWLVGLYLAEGSRSGNRHALQLSLSADEEHWVHRIEAVAKYYGGSCSYTINGGSLTVRLFGAVLHAMIETYIGGSVAIDKHLKVAAWRLPDEALRTIAQGYLDGDGHNDAGNGRWRLGFCRNYSLERDLRTLAARLGATLTLIPGHATYQGGESPSFRGEWRWERSGHWNEKDRGEVLEIRASRARGFWDIAVEDDPHLFALASGVLTHNCKPNPMPESTLDRCTKAHEYLFLLSKSERYLYDNDAIREPCDWTQNDTKFPDGEKGKRSGNKARKPAAERGIPGASSDTTNGHVAGSVPWEGTTRNKRDVWTVADEVSLLNWLRENEPDILSGYVDQSNNKRSVWTITSEPFPDAHFATFPTKLVRPCILAGSRPGDLVMDPFNGAGTTGLVAQQLGRRFVGIELNPDYCEMARRRWIGIQVEMFTESGHVLEPNADRARQEKMFTEIAS